MSLPTLPGAQAGPSTRPPAPAAQRATEIQNALKSIVLQTASTLRARTQQARLQSTISSSSATSAAVAVESIGDANSSLDKLTGECTRYLSLVHGLRDYLLHAQAALEIELEAATQREAEEAKRAAEAAAEALKRQQEAEEAARKKAEEEAERKRKEQPADTANTEEAGKGAVAVAQEDDSMAGLATPPLPAENKKEEGGDIKEEDAGKAANDAIVIDSDGDDEDDVPLAFAPKAGPSDGENKTIDLTESPALANAPKPDLTASKSTQPSDTAATTQPDASSTSTSAAPAPSIPGIDLSALGIDMSSLTNLTDLSSLGINLSSSTDTSTALAPATNFSELEKMMGIDLSSSANNDGSSTAMNDLSALGSFGGGTGGYGEDTDMFGTSSGGGLDLSNFDFSSLTGGDAGMGSGGGVDLSFLGGFTGTGGGEAKDNSAS